MNFFKGLVLAILVLLLLPSLVIFGAAYTLNSTLLNPDFTAAQVNKLDISALAEEFIVPQVVEFLPEEARFLEEDVKGVIAEVIAAQEPWLKEQVNGAVYSGYDFLLGKGERLAMTILLEPLKEDLGESLRESMKPIIMESLPARLASAPQSMIDQYYDEFFDEFYGQFADEIPSEFAIDESFIPSGIMAQIVQARQIISYFQIGYYILIGFMLLLVLLVILFGRKLRNITLTLGIACLLYGALQYATILATWDLLPSSLLIYEIPTALQSWIVGVADDVVAPLEVLSLGVLVGGVVLLIISFIARLRGA